MATGDKKRAVMTDDINNSGSSYPVLGPTGDGSNVTAAFTAAASRTNISTGEKLSVICGKIAKWFTDLGAAAFRAVDATPTAGSTNLVESAGVKSALNGKANAEALAIVADGNTHIAITAGQYVYVKNHSTLAEGLYKSTSNISANATLSSSNLTSDTNGGLNDFLLLTSENPLDGRILAPKGLTLSEFCGLYDKTGANGIISFSLSSANSQALSGYGGTGFGFAKRIDSAGITLLYFVLFQPAAHRISFGNINVSTQAVTLYGTYDFTT